MSFLDLHGKIFTFKTGNLSVRQVGTYLQVLLRYVKEDTFCSITNRCGLYHSPCIVNRKRDSLGINKYWIKVHSHFWLEYLKEIPLRR